MRTNALMSLPARVLAPLLLAVFALVGTVLNYFMQRHEYRELVAVQQQSRLTEILNSEQTRIEVQMTLGNVIDVGRLVSALALRSGFTHALLVNRDGRVVAAMSRTQVGWPLTDAIAGEPPEVQAGLLEVASSDPKGIGVVRPAGDADCLVAQVAIYPDHKLIVRVEFAPVLAARIAMGREELVRESLLILLFAMLLAALLHFLWFGRTAQLTDAVRAIGSGRLDVRSGLTGRDELGQIGTAVDRMAAEIETRQTKLQRLSALIDRSPVVAIEWANAPGWPVTFVSGSVAQWGYAVDDLVAEHVRFADLIHPDDLDAIVARLPHEDDDAASEYHWEYRLRCARGHWNWVEGRTWTGRDPDGRIASFHGVLVDITARRLAENALREQSDLLRLFYDLPFIGMAITSPRTRKWLKANDRLCEILGYSREELVQKTWDELTHPDDADADLAQVERILRGEIDGHRMDKRFLRKDGTTVFTTIDVRAVRGDGGVVDYFVATVQDITERHRSELALRQQKERLERAEAHAKLGSWEFELDTQQVWWSPQLYALLGLDPAEDAPSLETFLALIDPADRDRAIDAYKALADGRVVEVAPLRSAPDRGPLRWWYSSVAVEPGAHGRPRKLSGTILDVTALKDSEEALRTLNATLEARVVERTRQLENANRELESFSYAVSHDLKGPLRGIDGYSQILQEDYGDRLDDEGRQFLANIRRGVAQMHELIEDLLAYSRIERRPLDRSAIALPALVRDVVEGFAPEIAESRADVRIDVPNGLELSLDRNGLALVLRNLVGNALKFSRGATPPRVDIAAEADADRVRLSVRDNGIGFDMKYHDRIFEIFQRLHRSEDYPGTGVGLALVRKAVQRMGGSVRAESEPGLGASFQVEFPR